MPFVVEEDEAFDPVGICFFGSKRGMLEADRVSDTIEQFTVLGPWSGG
jgi:hypothetical protein